MKSAPTLFLIFALTNAWCSAQEKIISWDNTYSKNWPEGFKLTEIRSSADGSIQKAIVYKSRQSAPQPLIVSLHTWSGDYLQEDPLAKEVQMRDWNYIHPDFRGMNSRPEACGSNLVMADLDDAIQYVVKNGNVATDEVHVIGASGGGYATILAFMKLNYPAKSFNAWASISNLEEWYWECRGRGLKYAHDLELVTTNGGGFDPVVARERSPLLLPFPAEKRGKAALHIYAGIHDGYTGSVCILQSINMFNKLLAEVYPEQNSKRINEQQQLDLVAKRTTVVPDTFLCMGGRKIHLIRKLPQLSLTVFEGGHEMVVPQALALVPVYHATNTTKRNILTIGDSNAASETGWPAQLKKLLPFSTVINKSISGNTIGFDNLGNERLNTIKNIDRYLEEAYQEMEPKGNFDFIFVCLGTNDTKRIFKNRQKEVPSNLEVLIQKIKQWLMVHQKIAAQIVVVSPPPMDEQKADAGKYGGGDKLIQKNNLRFRKTAGDSQADFVDVYSSLKTDFSEKSTDGIHLTEKAQFQLALELVNYLHLKRDQSN